METFDVKNVRQRSLFLLNNAFLAHINKKKRIKAKKHAKKRVDFGKCSYLCTDFLVKTMTVEIGDTRFAALMGGLRQQIELLKQRCIEAESQVDQLKQISQEQQDRIMQLESDNQSLAEKYQGLQAGSAVGSSAEEITKLRDRYLAMIREIDLCLTKLNG